MRSVLTQAKEAKAPSVGDLVDLGWATMHSVLPTQGLVKSDHATLLMHENACQV